MTLRLLHLSNDFYPLVTGGTEIFVRQLIDAQLQASDRPTILWAAHQPPVRAVKHASNLPLSTEQFLLPPISRGDRLQQVSGEAASIPGFPELLDAFRPDFVHLHSSSERCGLSHAQAVKASGAKLLITVHAPGFSCIKRSLIDASGAVCDGQLLERRCTRCRLHNGGLPRWLAAAVALQQGWPLRVEAPGRLAHVLTAKQLTRAFQRSWLELCDLADAIHVLAAWSRDVLLRQGISREKIHLIRTAGPPSLPAPARQPMADGCLRLVNWGRCDPLKGLHLVIEAIFALPAGAPIQIDFYGPYWDNPYGRRLQQRIGGDPRFRLMGNLHKELLLPRLQEYDLAVVPSTCLETGPLTVLEAFAAGLPVSGSDLGGIHELLSDIPGCSLLPPNPVAWSQHFASLLAQPQLLCQRPPAPPQFDDVAQQLNNLLVSLVA